MRQFDVAIAGGGMVGASLALALAEGDRRLALIEAVSADSQAQPSFDDRTTALGNGARRIYETLGVWDAIAAGAAPIRRIHVSDAGRYGFARLEADSFGLPAFGYTVSNRHLGRVLWEALQARPGIELLCPARVAAVELSADAVTLRLEDAQGLTALRTRLAVAADGTHSLVKQAAGIGTRTRDYHQVALVAAVRTDAAADGTAYERCTRDGPIALLPRHDGSHAVIIACAAQRAAALRDCSEQDFCAQLQASFGWRAGRFLEVGRRAGYPLALAYASALTGTRVALLGNAAQSLHPIAAQGFNLGLRDVAVLAELVAPAADPGADSLLADYARRRHADRRAMIAFTDRLARLFSTPHAPVAVARDLGLLLFDRAQPAKQALSRLSWGFGPLPRLSRGLRP